MHARPCVFVCILLSHKAKVQEEEEFIRQHDEDEPVSKRPKMTTNDEEIKKKQLEKNPTAEVNTTSHPSYSITLCGRKKKKERILRQQR
jgi:hypothetical protein